MIDYLRVGVVTAPHGLRGALRVYPTTEDVSRYDDLEHVFVKTRTGYTELKVSAIRYQKDCVLVKFRGIDTIEQAQKLVKRDLLIPREEAIALPEGEYFISDLVGLTVSTDAGEALGTLTDVLATGANEVYVVDDHGEELLIPAIPDCILKIDLEKGNMLVHLLEGLR